MSKYVTVIKWSQMNGVRYNQILDYVKQQTDGNGTPTTYNGVNARSWLTQDAANAFCDFAKKLPQDPEKPTTATVYTVD